MKLLLCLTLCTLIILACLTVSVICACIAMDAGRYAWMAVGNYFY